LIAEALQFLFGQAQQAAEVKSTLLVPDARQRQYVTNRGDRYTVDVPTPPRCHHVRSVRSLITAVKMWGAGGVVFLDRNKVVLVCDDETRWDQVYLDLPFHPLFQMIGKLGQPLEHRSFARLLRQDLNGHVDPSFVSQIRSVVATQSAAAESAVQLGREKGMRQFEASLSEELPDVVTVQVPVYDVVDLMDLAPVSLGFDVSLPPAPLTFALRPLPGSCEAAAQMIGSVLADRLGDLLDDTPLLLGSP
jgi:hypothetical protein